MTFINVRKHESGRITLSPGDYTREEMGEISSHVIDKLLEIRVRDNLALMPIEGRQVYLNDLEYKSLVFAGRIIGTDKVKKLFGYQIITDEDLK